MSFTSKNGLYILIIAVLLGFIGYQYIPPAGVEQISTDELKERLALGNSSDVMYVDVREVYEFEAGHIEQMVNVPLSSLEETYHELPTGVELVIICRSGARSMQAIDFLQSRGYTQLTNVKGGMLEWDGDVVTK